MSAPNRVLIVGNGPVGSLIAHLLLQAAETVGPGGAAAGLSGLNVTLWDKARKSGGRFSSSSTRKVPGVLADLGGQYLTQSKGDKYAKYFSELQAANVIQPLRGELINQHEKQKALPNYVALAGMGSVCDYYLGKAAAAAAAAAGAASPAGAGTSGAAAAVAAAAAAFSSASASTSPAALPLLPAFRIQQNKKLQALSWVAEAMEGEATPRQVWRAEAEDGTTETFSAVCFTMPSHQVNLVQGDVHPLLEGSGIAEGLSKVQYSSRFAEILYFPAEAAVLEQLAASLPYVGRYVSSKESEVIRFISFDSQKRLEAVGGASGAPAPASAPAAAGPASVVVHTSVEFGAAHVEEDAAAVEKVILQELHRLQPGLPVPAETKCHKWRYSQVQKGFHAAAAAAGAAPAGAAPASGAEAGAASDGASKDVTAPVAAPAAASAGSAAAALLVHKGPGLILAGDYLTESNFEGCIASAEEAAWLIQEEVARK